METEKNINDGSSNKSASTSVKREGLQVGDLPSSSKTPDQALADDFDKLDDLILRVEDNMLDLAFIRKEYPRRVVDLLNREHIATRPKMTRSVDPPDETGGGETFPQKGKEGLEKCKVQLTRTLETANSLGKEFESLTYKLKRLHETVLLNKAMSKSETDAILFSTKRRRRTSSPVASATATTPTTTTLPGGDISAFERTPLTPKIDFRKTKSKSPVSTNHTITLKNESTSKIDGVTSVNKVERTPKSRSRQKVPLKEPETPLAHVNTPVRHSPRRSKPLNRFGSDQ